MFCHSNQRLAAIDHIIWDAVVGGIDPICTRIAPSRQGGVWHMEGRGASNNFTTKGLCLSVEPVLTAWSQLGAKIPNYDLEKCAGPTTGPAVFWGRGVILEGGRSF